MPLIEVEESELRDAKAAHALLAKFHGNPKTRIQLQALVKELNPNAVLPEYDATQGVLTEIRKRDDEIAKLRKEMEDDRSARAREKDDAKLSGTIEEGRKLLRDMDFTSEGIEKVEKLMQERGIVDYEAAAALFERTQPKDDPVMPTDYGRSWDFARPDDKDEDHKLLLRDPKAYQNKALNDFFREKRLAGGRR